MVRGTVCVWHCIKITSCARGPLFLCHIIFSRCHMTLICVISYSSGVIWHSSGVIWRSSGVIWYSANNFCFHVLAQNSHPCIAWLGLVWLAYGHGMALSLTIIRKCKTNFLFMSMLKSHFWPGMAWFGMVWYGLAWFLRTLRTCLPTFVCMSRLKTVQLLHNVNWWRLLLLRLLLKPGPHYNSPLVSPKQGTKKHCYFHQ